MNDLNDYGLYQYYTTTSTTTVRPYRRGNKSSDEVELDDTAPLPLLIGIGLALFIGFVILVLICCLCRRRRPPQGNSTDHSANAAAYQRAPMNDGMHVGGGVAYPMTTVPPTSYPNSSVPYPPPHIGSHMQHNYGVIGSGVSYSNAPHSQYPQHPPHFGGVPTFPPNQYIPSLPLPPHSAQQQTHSLSHSSQTSSVSGTTADPLVPSSSPAMQSQQQTQQQQQQHYHPHHQQLPSYPQHQHMPPPSALQHHQHMQPQFMTGRQSPAPHYPQMSYSAMMASHGPSMTTNAMSNLGSPSVTSSVTSPAISHPIMNHQVGVGQSSSYTDEEE